MGARHVFNLRSEDRRRVLPVKVLMVQRQVDTFRHILLKLFAYLLFHRERILLEPSLDDEMLSFRPDVAQLDYEGRITLWIECGECSMDKLDRLAVKAPYGEIWVVTSSPAEAEDLLQRVRRQGLRRGRYGIVGLDPGMLEEVTGIAVPRNDLTWYRGTFDPPVVQFDFNGLWFESEFLVLRH